MPANLFATGHAHAEAHLCIVLELIALAANEKALRKIGCTPPWLIRVRDARDNDQWYAVAAPQR